VCRRRFALVRKPFEVGLSAFSGDHQPDSRARRGPQPSMTVRDEAPRSQSDCRRPCRPVAGSRPGLGAEASQFRRHRRDLHGNPGTRALSLGHGSTSTRPHLDARRTKITPTALHHYQGRDFQCRRQLNTDHGAAAVSAKPSRCITWATPRPISVRAKTFRSCGPNGITPFRQSSPASSGSRSWSAKEGLRSAAPIIYLVRSVPS
jgi:hypothetical protein